MDNKEYKKIWYEKNKERIKEERKKYYEENKNKINQYRKVNSDKIKKTTKIYIENNKELINKKRNEKHKVNILSNPLYRIKHNLRGMYSRIFKTKRFQKVSKSEIMLGCSFEEFKLYIESLWEDWMNWDNYGLYNGTEKYGWDIDHKIPISTAITIDEVLKLNHYTNLQPLCSYTNRYVKMNKV